MSKTKAHIQYRSNVKFLKNGKGVRLPGVTTVISLLNKPALVPWANKLGLQGTEVGKYVDDKADIGTLSHAMITDGLQNKPTDTSDYTENQIAQAQNCVISYYEWEKKYKIEPIILEKPMVSEEFCFGGTIDIYATVNGVKELIDLKTGNNIWPEHITQVAAYRHLLEENGHKVERLRILNVPRAETENFQEITVSNSVCEIHWQMFMHLLKIYELRKKVKYELKKDR